MVCVVGCELMAGMCAILPRCGCRDNHYLAGNYPLAGGFAGKAREIVDLLARVGAQVLDDAGE